MSKIVSIPLSAAALLVLVLLLRDPVRTTGVRLGITAAALLLLAMAVLHSWRWNHVGKAVLALSLCGVAWGISTASLAAPSPDSLAAALARYEDTPYVWGGETRRGIDCSGLFRMALCDALLAEWRPGAALRIWWNDAAARELGTTYSGLLEPAGEVPSIRESTLDGLPPGSIAVATSGVHVLAHLGGGRWIQASPGEGRVVIRSASDPDPWHGRPVRIYRMVTPQSGSASR